MGDQDRSVADTVNNMPEGKPIRWWCHNCHVEVTKMVLLNDAGVHVCCECGNDVRVLNDCGKKLEEAYALLKKHNVEVIEPHEKKCSVDLEGPNPFMGFVGCSKLSDLVKKIQDLEMAEDQLGKIRATLQVNYGSDEDRKGRPAQDGITTNSRVPIGMLVDVLGAYVDKVKIHTELLTMAKEMKKALSDDARWDGDTCQQWFGRAFVERFISAVDGVDVPDLLRKRVSPAAEECSCPEFCSYHARTRFERFKTALEQIAEQSSDIARSIAKEALDHKSGR